MSNTIQLEPIETDVTGWGSDYYRRKQEPTEPYYVENLDFDDTVQKEYPNRDFDVEQYIVNQAYERGQNPDRPFQKTLRPLDWSRGGDKVRTEYWDPKGVARGKKNPPNARYNHGRAITWEEDGKQHNIFEAPKIQMFGEPKKAPYTHEFSHHLYNFQDKGYPDPRIRVNIPTSDDQQLDRDNGNPFSHMDKWRSAPWEVQAEASQAKRDYIHNDVGNRIDMTQSPYMQSHDGGKSSRLIYKGDYGVEPFDKNHPAVKGGKPIPDEIIDDMFKQWMQRDDHGWGESYRDKPEEFPVEMFKEALRLGKNDQKPAGLFTGRGPQTA